MKMKMIRWFRDRLQKKIPFRKTPTPVPPKTAKKNELTFRDLSIAIPQPVDRTEEWADGVIEAYKLTDAEAAIIRAIAVDHG